MSEKYWERALSWVDGCTPCSPGCLHCWSAGMWHRFHKTTEEGHEEEWLTDCIIDATGDLSDWRKVPKRIEFNGLIKTRPDRLSIPLKRRKPTVYAVWNDLFHEKVPNVFVHSAGSVIYDSMDRHKYLILTKRPERMLSYALANRFRWWPFENAYSGLTVCNQQEADEKIPIFLQVPGKKFLSLEPLLSDIDLHLCLECQVDPWECHEHLRVDAVILGGETGPGARPMHPDWVRSVRDQCAAAGVPFFFKQWGEWLPVGEMPTSEFRPIGKNDALSRFHLWGDFDKNVSMKIGRRAAGRLLDGRTHDDLPWRKP